MLNLDHRKLRKPLVAYDSLGEKEIGKLSTAFQPGEWVFADDGKSKKILVGYINPFGKKNELFRSVGEADKTLSENEEHTFVEKIIRDRITEAIDRRAEFYYLQEGCRLIFGGSDKLPGLVVDKVEKYLLIQINTMGIFRFKETIEETLTKAFPEHSICFLQNKNILLGEDIPEHGSGLEEDWFEAIESGIRYSISREGLQKTGFYFDHRDNRLSLKNLIASQSGEYKSSIDLFCYLGAWGMTLLKAGLKECVFVDQANLVDEFNKNLEVNGLSSCGTFVRSDVFKFLDVCIKEKKKFDIVVSDPPAFIKNSKDKRKAIIGYEKLHLKALACTNQNGIFVAASCTQPVSIEEFDLTVQKAAERQGLNLQMLDLGFQSKDHPTSSLSSKSNYIKYIAYKVSYKTEIK